MQSLAINAVPSRAINAVIAVPCSAAPCSGAPCNGAPYAMDPHAMEPHIILSVELLESQQKADVVKTDYSDSLLMITRLKTRMIITLHTYNLKLKQIKQNTITINHNIA